jgi:hypothetical protein
MEYADLYVFPEDHPPSPYEHPVTIFRTVGGSHNQGGDLTLPAGLCLCAIGWLERPGFATGQVPEDCIQALVAAHPGKIVSDGTRGIHTCTLCGESLPQMRWRNRTVQLKGHGHYLVRMEKKVYMAPELLLHYLSEHRYSPPQEFVLATIQGEFLGVDDLEVTWRSEGN